MRKFYWLILCLLLAASCSKSSEDGTTQEGPDTQGNNEPAVCETPWYEHASHLKAPVEPYFDRCVVGKFKLFDDEVAGCYPDEYNVEFYRQGETTPYADAQGDIRGRGPIYRLFNGEGEVIVHADHRLVGDQEDPLTSIYWRYDDQGRLVDIRRDEYVWVTGVSLQEFHEDGAVLGHDFPSYFNYQDFINTGSVKVDPDGRWEGCEHTIYRESGEQIEVPSLAEIPNSGLCTVHVYYHTSGGAETFYGSYHIGFSGESDTWSYSRTTTYLASGNKESERTVGFNEGHQVATLKSFEYDSTGRMTKETTDRGEDGVFENVVTYTWDGNTVHRHSVSGEFEYESIEVFDDNGRIIRRDDDFNYKGQPTHRFVITYDDEGRKVYEAKFDSDLVDQQWVFYEEPYHYIEREYSATGKLLREKEVNNPSYGGHSDEAGEREDVYTYHPVSELFVSDKLKTVTRTSSYYGGFLDSRDEYRYHCSSQ